MTDKHEDIYDYTIKLLDEFIGLFEEKNKELEEELIKEQSAALQEEARNRLVYGPPQKRRPLAIVKVHGLKRAIDFDADEDVAQTLGQYGRIDKRWLNSTTAWTLYADYRYDFGEIVAYFKDLELVYDAGL